MSRRSVRFSLILAAGAATTSLTAVVNGHQPPTALMGGDGPVIPFKNAAMIVTTEGGFRYMAGQPNTQLTVSIATGRCATSTPAR